MLNYKWFHNRYSGFRSHSTMVYQASSTRPPFCCQVMLILRYIFAITTIFGKHAFSMKQQSLRNTHLMVEGEYWYPYLIWKCPDFPGFSSDCTHNRTYDGVMWHLLLFMQRARNFTFTLIHEADYEWGSCYAIDNCTGMIGMVNRGEVDFALGNHLRFLLIAIATTVCNDF